MAQLTIEAHPRSVTGKKVKTLRRKGVLPANVYGHNVPSQPLELDAHTFSLLQRRLSPSSIVDLVVDGARPRPVMIHRTQRSVRTGLPTHVEFFQINPRERLTASVPLVLLGESEMARREANVMVLQEMDSIEVTCLPGDLPTSIEVPIEGLNEVGAAVFVRDLQFDRSKIDIKAHEDEIVVTLTQSQAPAADVEAEAALSETASAEAAEQSETDAEPGTAEA